MTTTELRKLVHVHYYADMVMASFVDRAAEQDAVPNNRHLAKPLGGIHHMPSGP